MLDQHSPQKRKIMLFRDYIEILWQAYLEDRGYLQKLRDRIQSEEFTKDSLFSPEFDDFKSINPVNPETHHGNRIKFHPSPLDPQQGVYTYEQKEEARRRLRVIRECLQRGRDRD